MDSKPLKDQLQGLADVARAQREAAGLRANNQSGPAPTTPALPTIIDNRALPTT